MVSAPTASLTFLKAREMLLPRGHRKVTKSMQVAVQLEGCITNGQLQIPKRVCWAVFSSWGSTALFGGGGVGGGGCDPVQPPKPQVLRVQPRKHPPKQHEYVGHRRTGVYPCCSRHWGNLNPACPRESTHPSRFFLRRSLADDFPRRCAGQPWQSQGCWESHDVQEASSLRTRTSSWWRTTGRDPADEVRGLRGGREKALLFFWVCSFAHAQPVFLSRVSPLEAKSQKVPTCHFS